MPATPHPWLVALLLAGVTARAELASCDLPPGYAATLAAQTPLVVHPVTATTGPPGVLFVCDMAGVNLNKAELEKELPNRVLRLVDQDDDGIYDRMTIFADRMTFPNGGVWLDGSLYVCSAPSLWKLTDADGDGVAERRELIATGFEFTGNAADLHGPFLHPNGRLYWCHGRKGYKATESDGKVVATGLSSGIWSCRPDGLDLRWHSLVAGDNPVEIDFTPEGEILGTMNLFYSRPRGDVIVHWLRGGVYPREDQMKVVDGLPRTLETMPVVHNFGHVAVSGCTFYHSGALAPDWRGNLFVTHFNTLRVSRMEVTRDGATYKVAEREFLKLHAPDAHLTDVLEDRDGSLLVVDTGGWFRNGCPASLMAKPEVAGGIYRIRRKGTPPKVEPWGAPVAKVWTIARRTDESSARELAALVGGDDASVTRTAANALAETPRSEAIDALIAALQHRDPGVQLAAVQALGSLPQLDESAIKALLRLLGDTLEPVLEHQAMHAVFGTSADSSILLAALGDSTNPVLQRRVLRVLDQMPDSPLESRQVIPFLDAADFALAHSAATAVARREGWMSAVTAYFQNSIRRDDFRAGQLATIEIAVKPWLGNAHIRLLASMLMRSRHAESRRTGWRILANSTPGVADPAWVGPLEFALAQSAPGDQTLVIDAIAHQQAPELTAALSQFAADETRPLTLRLKALGAAPKSNAVLSSDTFKLLTDTATQSPSAASRLEAARLLANAKLSKELVLKLAPALAAIGPLELRELLPMIRRNKEADIGAAWANALKNAAALGSLAESEVRTVFSSYPPEVFAIIAPALRTIAAETEMQRRRLDTLPALVAANGHVDEGRTLFTTGKGACVSCHRIGEIGNVVGPDLTTIGRIRSPRDILESVLFPNASMAQGYEAHTVETAGGQSLLGVIRRNLPDALVLVDPTGQEQTVPRAQITALQELPTSLMPPGLDRTLTEQELLDLVAFLASQK